jgi:hypothetical protein
MLGIGICLLLLLAGCHDSFSERGFIVKALNISALPPNTEIINSNWPMGNLYGYYEYHLEIRPEDDLSFLSGNTFSECNTTRTNTNSSFIHFRDQYNFELYYCEKAISDRFAIAIYKTKDKRNIFILIDRHD